MWPDSMWTIGLAVGLREAIEPVIDGVRLVDHLKMGNGEIEHRGLTSITGARWITCTPSPR
ncbi:hypothetical protein [Candidatus Solirubrobacter pratensis]|uniref:hypothetical protein n=1 Tax=Candidatus Solirubrobacter pratensis TaxID=1298857 RepID=UPI0004122C1A|nr:hypothetical protein [Candidatus Solirubrobacter pratensis]